MTTSNILSQLGSAGVSTGFKNRIINGAMVIDQRNAGASVTITNTGATTYTLDRWFAYGSVASKFSVQQNAGSVTPPSGFSNYLGCTSASAYSVGAGDVFLIGQSIEGFNTADLSWGTAQAKTITLSFQVYSSLTGTFGGALKNSANNRTYPFSYSIPSANTWTTISITVAGDTSGTWIGATNGIGIQVSFGLGVGSTGSGTAGTWSSTNYTSVTGATSVVGTSGATFYITGVQLEVGTTATNFDYLDYGRSLIQCQRYYEKSFNQSTAPANNVGTNTGECLAAVNQTVGNGYTGAFAFRVSKRTSPTITLYNRANASNDWAWYIASGTITNGGQIATSGENYFSMQLNGGTTSTITTGHFTASAEL